MKKNYNTMLQYLIIVDTDIHNVTVSHNSRYRYTQCYSTS